MSIVVCHNVPGPETDPMRKIDLFPINIPHFVVMTLSTVIYLIFKNQKIHIVQETGCVFGYNYIIVPVRHVEMGLEIKHRTKIIGITERRNGVDSHWFISLRNC